MFDELARLRAIEDIKVLKARYFRLVDTKDWLALRALFCDHATVHYTDADHGPMPIEEAMKFVRASLEDAVSLHHGHMPEIDVPDCDHATAVWAMEDQLFWPENSKNSFGLYRMHGAGHYHETYERHGGRWLIATLKLTRLRRTIELLPQATA